jgi:GNAT superfamily N-acetyltransferase
MIIREVKATDAASIAKVNADSWKTTYAGILPQEYLDSISYEQRTSIWQARLSDPKEIWQGWFYYIAEDEKGNIVGFAGGGPERTGNPRFSSELGVIYLLPSHQRMGIGRKLMATIALRLKQQGHKSMLVWVLEANHNRSFYEALGGRRVAERHVNIGGVDLVEVAYGWHDLGLFARMLKQNSGTPLTR